MVLVRAIMDRATAADYDRVWHPNLAAAIGSRLVCYR
jgi:hypothetical protein